MNINHNNNNALHEAAVERAVHVLRAQGITLNEVKRRLTALAHTGHANNAVQYDALGVLKIILQQAQGRAMVSRLAFGDPGGMRR